MANARDAIASFGFILIAFLLSLGFELKCEAHGVSAEAAGGFDDHGEDAGFVAGYEQRDMAVDGDFGLSNCWPVVLTSVA